MKQRLSTGELISKHKFLRYIKDSPFRVVELVIPLDIYVKMSYVYTLCHSSKVTVSFMIDFIFNFGVDIIIECVEKYGLRNILHLMKMKDLVKATLLTYFKKRLERFPLIDLNDYRRVEIEFDRRKYTLAQRLEFLEFVNRYDKSFLNKEKLLLDAEDLEVMFNAYDNIERETYDFDSIGKD